MFLSTAGGRVGAVIGLLLVVAYGVALAWAFESQSYNVWGSLLVAPLVGAVNLILIWRVGQREDDPWIPKLMYAGFALKMLGSFGRYFTIFVIYGGAGDANRYNFFAVHQHVLWRQGMFVWDPLGKTGTQNLELVTTAVYTIIGPAPLAAFLVFASFAFWGCYFLYRAFRTAIPDGNHRLYAALLFLLPSLLFWPSSIGKEAWIMLWLGVGALGIARFLTQRSGAVVPMLLGILGTTMIRPHVTVLLAAAVMVAVAFRPVGDQAMGVLGKAGALLVVGVAVAILTTQSAEFLGIDDLDPEAISGSIEWAGGQTEQGGSAFEPVPLTNPLGVPAAIVTQLFRPFPWEVTSLPMLLQSLEGVFMVWLIWWRRASLWALPRFLRKNAFVTFAAVYALGYIIAFAGFGNFGIVARQRTLMVPFALLLLALPTRKSTVSGASADAHSLART